MGWWSVKSPFRGRVPTPSEGKARKVDDRIMSAANIDDLPDLERNPLDCQTVREVLGRVGDKWTILVMAVLGNRRMRFKELHNAATGISERVLSVTLRTLERDGLLVRTVYATVPPRVEYELTERGLSLKMALRPVGDWFWANWKDIEESRRRFDRDARAETAPILIKG
jgi:DNA-binding HxlR family transcriptional regulator